MEATRRVALFLLPALTAGGASLTAQDVSSAEADLLAFEDIPEVFAASKFSQKVTEAPASVTVITARDIRMYGYRTLSEILQGVRGLYVRDDRNYDQVGVRGFGRPGDYNNRILLLIDGHRVNDDIYEQAPIDRSFPLDVALIDRIEVVRGPGSSLYGTCGFFAVVDIITRRAAAIDGIEVAGGLGNLHSRETRFAFGREIDGTGLMLAGSFFKTVGERDIYFPAFDDPATNDGIAERADGETAKRLFAQVELGDFTLQGAFVDRNKQIPTGSYGTVFDDPNTATDDLRYYFDLSYEHETEDAIAVSARVFFDRYVYHGDYVYDFGTPTVPDPVTNDDQSHGATFGVDARTTLPLAQGNRLTLGGELRLAVQEDQSNRDVAVNLDDRRNGHNFAVYAQDEMRIGDDLILNAGLRLDYFSTFHTTLSPRLAAIYQLGEATTVKAIYGRAFRAPTPYELYYNDSDITQKANPGLEAETIDTYEAILEQRFGQALRCDVSLFHYDIGGLITQVVDTNDGLLVFRNVDTIRTNGFELGLESRWPEWLRSRISYSVQDSEDATTDSRPTNSPRHVAQLHVDAEFAEHWASGLEAVWVSARSTPQATEAGAYAIVNLNLVATDLLPGLELSATARNLFDDHYDHVAGEEHLQDVLPDRGRLLWIQATYRF
ncbi:MAG: TonB-dependent receptor [Planctomycetota bacterium]